MDFLKRIFGKSERIEVPAIELKDWLIENSKDRLDAVNIRIDKEFKKIDEYVEKLGDRLQVLDDAKPQHDNLSEREKHIMEGNKVNYLKEVGAFMEELELPELEFVEVYEFVQGFNKRIEELDKKSSKAYFVLKNFYDKEMRDIAMLIKEIERAVIEVKNHLDDPDVKKYKALVSRIRELNEISIHNSELLKELEGLRKELAAGEEAKAEVTEKLRQLKNGKSYKSYTQDEKEKERLEEQLTVLKTKFNNRFLEIERPLKKYSRGIMREEMLKKYLENPIDALEQDADLNINKELQKLNRQLGNGQIEVKQKAKMQELIEKLMPHIASVRDEHRDLKDKSEGLSNRIAKTTVKMDLKEYEYQLEHIDKKIDEINSKIADREKKLSAFELDKKKANLENELKDFLRLDVAVGMGDQ